MNARIHVLFGVAFVGGFVVAAVSDGWTWAIVGLGTSGIALYVWALLVDRDRQEWDDRGMSWSRVPWRQSKMLQRSERPADVPAGGGSQDGEPG